ncbi:MAG: PSD1 and planctomycete cytochrome C domain-containing protein [Pirellulales bacterium]
MTGTRRIGAPWLIWTLFLIGLVACSNSQSAFAADDGVNFTRQIQPILARRCVACHGPDKGEGGLRLHESEPALAELDSGARAIVPGNPTESELLARISSTDESTRMPPEGEPLKPAEIELLRQWIAEGAKWEQHWAFQPLRQVEPPAVKDTAWPLQPVDFFILHQLERRNLRPAPPADKRTLIRRVYYDLTGLPPTEEQVRKFVEDQRPEAYEELIDELLASPHYGEQWGRHWLDLVRYAETNSFERDGAKPNAWKYRDYVVNSFNDDKPYDQFVREQLAGDELDQVTKETLTATGFYRLGIWDDEPADPLQAQYDELDNIVSTIGQVYLGLTINCARCHDHKIDPITQADYYSLLAFLADVTPYGRRGSDPRASSQIDVTPPEVTDAYKRLDQLQQEQETRAREIEQTGIVKMSAPDQRRTEGDERNAVLKEKLQANISPQEWEEYQRLQGEIELTKQQRRKLPERESVMGLGGYEPKPRTTHVLMRGSPLAEGDEVQPRFLDLYRDPAPVVPADPPADGPAGRRRLLADWIVAPNNRLTARVMANRVWQFHFGRGIVRSANNFGQLGTPPTHPDLLEWLAGRHVSVGWRFKPLHREILLSQTYRMSSQGDPQALAADPTNDLFWRFDMRRLSAEELRDSILAVTGELNREVGGPSFYETIPQEVLAGQSVPGAGWGQSSELERSRRSLYIHVKRSLVTPLLSTFDFPDTDTSCEARFVTVQPGQALSLLNGDFLHVRAGVLADRVRREVGADRRAQVERTLQLVLTRQAEAQEIEEGLALIDRLISRHGVSADEAFRYYCLAALNLNEFIYLD